LDNNKEGTLVIKVIDKVSVEALEKSKGNRSLEEL